MYSNQELLGHGLLTALDEVRLAERIQSGRRAQDLLDATPPGAEALRSSLEETASDGVDAWRELVLSNVRLVLVALKNWPREVEHLEWDDLLQAGLLGVMEAARRFDAGKHNRFSTYAMYWIRYALDREREHESDVRIPIHARRRRLEALTQISAGLDLTEAAKTINMDLEVVKNLMSVSRSRVALDASLRQDRPEFTLASELPDTGLGVEDAAINSLHRSEVRSAVRKLPEPHRRLVIHLYGLGVSAATERAFARSTEQPLKEVKQCHVEALEMLQSLVEHA